MNGDDTNSKTNVKLDILMKKSLEPSTFEQIRYYESCIVVGERYDKVFSYVILGHEWIYVTENPPKTLKEEVHYRDVVSIELKNDFPDFLGGQERSNTLHAVITYRSPVRGHKSLARTLSTKPIRPASPRPVYKSLSAPDVALPARPKSASPRINRRLPSTQSDLGDDDDVESVDSFLSMETASSTDSLNSLTAKSETGLPTAGRYETRKVSAPTFVSDRMPITPTLEGINRNNSDAGVKGSDSKLSGPLNAHKESVLHLYMLKSDSPVMNHLTNAWNNYLIRGTLLCDVEYEMKTTQQRKTTHERLAFLFDQLKHEVMLPDNSMEDIFSLMNELKTATEKNFVLKKFFWKHGDLFYFTVDYIKRYIPGKPTADETPSDRSKRADEIELVNLLLEFLRLELRETDVLPQRSNCLCHAEGRHLADLAVLCTSQVRLPQPYYVPSRKASELLKQVEADQTKHSLNQELSELAFDYTRLSSCVVYELFLLAKQDIYCSGTFVNISWLIRKIKESKNLDLFVERIFTQCMKQISPSSSREQLSPRDAVALYQQLFVLKTLLEQCTSVLTLLRTKFIEEFKYYIQGPVLWSKLPPSLTISKPTITVLERIMTRVLQKDVRLSVPEVRVC